MPRLIDGRTPGEYFAGIRAEHNAIVDRFGWRGMRRWEATSIANQWSAVRYRAPRLYALRLRLSNAGRAGDLPTPSILDPLPREWYEGGVAVSTPRVRTATATAPAALLAMEPDIEGLTFGVELEHYTSQQVSRSRLAALITQAGLPASAEQYNHHLRNHWKLVTDASLHDLRRGTEVVSPILQGADGFGKVALVCKVMEDNGGTVRRRAGMHVHVGMRNQGVEVFRRLLKLYGHFEGAIDQITSRSRRGSGNGYCASTRAMLARNGNEIGAASTMVELSRAYSHSNRNMKVNLESYWRHTTVEFRQHQGTVDAVKAQHWIKLCLKLVKAAKDGVEPSGPDTLQNLASCIKLDAAELAYYERRAEVLARVQTERR